MRLISRLIISILITASIFSIGAPVIVYASKERYRTQNDVIYSGGTCGLTGAGTAAGAASGVGAATVSKDCGERGYADGARNSQKNKEQIWSFLKSKGLSDEAAAGIMGNMEIESAFMPDAQNGKGEGENPLDFVPSSQNGRGCVGLVQWCYGRAESMINKAKAEGKDWRCLDYQLDYMWYEMTETSESQVMDPLKASGSSSEAAMTFARIYERPGESEYVGRDTKADEVFQEFTGKAPTTSNNTSSEASSGACAAARTGASSAVSEMNGFNYAFPVQLAQNEVSNGYGWPCPGICHHDGTAAFDLSRNAQDDTSEGVPVVAITDGEIARFNNKYSGVDGCQSFQLMGKDGYWYWYGHVQGASVNNGSTVTAGQVIAEIGRRACTGNGSYPHLHIDRGNKGSAGGSVGNRDTGFTPVMNELWKRLGGGSSNVDL